MLIIVSFIAYVFVVRFVTITGLSQHWVSVLAWSVIFTVVFLAILYMAMHYIEMLSFVSKKWLNLKHALVGVIALSAITTYEFNVIVSDLVLSLLSIFMFIAMFFFGTRVRESVVTRFPLPKRDLHKIVSVYPPQQYSDMAVYHLIIVFTVLMPLIVKYLHLSIRKI